MDLLCGCSLELYCLVVCTQWNYFVGVHWNCIVWLYVLNGTTLWLFIGIVLFGISNVYLKHTVIVHEKDTYMSIAHVSIPIPIALRI